jgi:hypothetical protein
LFATASSNVSGALEDGVGLGVGFTIGFFTTGFGVGLGVTFGFGLGVTNAEVGSPNAAAEADVVCFFGIAIIQPIQMSST